MASRTVQFKPDGGTVTEGIMSATKPLKPQLAAAGYKPSDITYFVLSHYHSDHTANANDFAGATWIVQKAERDFMFADKPQGIIQPTQYSALKNAKTTAAEQRGLRCVRRRERGDQVDARAHARATRCYSSRLPKRGPVVLAGDLYHYPEERATGRIPTFEFNAEQSSGVEEEDRGVHQAEQSRALDRARHRDAREAAEGAGVRGVII